jgi:Ca2+-binding RTX toxin-like protein
MAAVGGKRQDLTLLLDRGDGDDILIGGAANDALSGEGGADLIDGGQGIDVLCGRRGSVNAGLWIGL